MPVGGSVASEELRAAREPILTNWEARREDHSAVKSSFWNWNAIVALRCSIVHRVLPKADAEANEAADDETQICETEQRL